MKHITEMKFHLIPVYLVYKIEYQKRKAEIDQFNLNNRWRKRGISTAIMTYSMAYFGKFPAFVAICHSDGTVIVSHGGIECGQGINTKVAQVAAHTLGTSLDFISIKATDTIIGINSFVTGAGVGSESVCFVSNFSK